jgi:antitoxin component YwqK of YwqJK toxin-antitoxin module
MKNVLYIVLSFLLLTGCLGLLDKIFGTRKRFIITSYENGQKRTEVNFNHGRGNGLWTSWYDNGQKEIESNFTDGEPHGLLTFWFETGQVRRNKI